MAIEAARLIVKVGADTQDAESGLDKVQQKVRDVAGQAQRAGTQTAGFGASLRGVAQQATSFALALGATRIASGIFDVARQSIIGFNAQLEQAHIAWTTMLGSADAARGMLRDLQQFAIQTPFEFPGLLDASRRLLAMGFAASEIIPLMTDVGDAAAALGLGTEGINRITLALGQMRTATKINAQDMRQLTEVGIPAWQILADALGVSVVQAQKMASEGKVASSVFIEAFSQFAQQNYGGMMEAQSRTFMGAMSNIRDSAMQLGAAAFQPLFARISELAQGFARLATEGSLAEWAGRIAGALGRLLDMFDRIPGPVKEGLALFVGLAAAAAILIPVISGVGTVLGALIGPVGLIIAAVAALYMAWRSNFLGIRDILAQVWQAIVDAFTWLVGFFASFGQEAQAIWTRLWYEVRSATADAADTIIDMVFGLAQGVLRVLRSMYGAVGREDIVEGWQDNLERLKDSIKGTTREWLGMDEAVEKTGWTIGNEMERGREILGGVGDAISGLFAPAMEEAADASLDAGEAALQAAGGIGELGDAAKEASYSAGELVSSLVMLHPATQAASSAVQHWERQIEGVNQALRANQAATKAAQARYEAMQARLRSLNEQLSRTKQRLDELSRPRLLGMGEMEMQIQAIQAQLTRLDLARSLGVPLEQIIRQYPLLTAGAEAYLRTLPQTEDELEKMLEQLRLMYELRYDERLRLLQEAAEPPAPEISYEEALAGIGQAHREMDRLTQQIIEQEAALQAQQAAIDALKAAGEGLNETLRVFQEQLQRAQERQSLVNQALEIAYKWFLEDRQKMVEMGGEAAHQAAVVDVAARELLASVSDFAGDTTAISEETLAGLITSFQQSSASAVLAVADNLGQIPTDIWTTHHVVTVYEGGGVPMPRAGGGPVESGRAYIVGERGPELFVPRDSGIIYPARRDGFGAAAGTAAGGEIYIDKIIVEGSVLSARGLAEDVRRELLKVKRRNLETGL